MEPIVIYKESDFLVINKPAGLLVHGTKNSPGSDPFAEPSVAAWAVKNYPEIRAVGDDPMTRPGIVHRLDRDTSGVMVIPRTQEAFLFFKNLFQTKEIHKTYIALVYGIPRDRVGVLNKPIGLNSGSTKRTVFVKNAKMVKDAVTKYEVEATFNVNGVPVSIIRAEPLTGRTHQIRVHLASIGCPVVGDTLYGPKLQKINITRQFLHADSIEFPTPRGNRMTISADLPKELSDLVAAQYKK